MRNQYRTAVPVNPAREVESNQINNRCHDKSFTILPWIGKSKDFDRIKKSEVFNLTLTVSYATNVSALAFDIG